MPDNEKRRLHLYCAIAPVFVYYGITFVVTVAAGYIGLGDVELNLVNSVVNLLVIYFYFYKRYELMFGAERMPSLLPGRSVLPGRNVGIPLLADYIWVIMAGVSVAIFANNMIEILHLGEISGTYQEVAESIYSGTWFDITIRTVVLAAFLEEFMIRGLCYRAFSQVAGRIVGMIVSSVIFGLIHGNLLQGIYAFLLGILFSYIYDCFGRKMPAPILAHMSANIVSVLGSILPSVAWFFVRNRNVLTIVSFCWLVLSVIMIKKVELRRQQ